MQSRGSGSGHVAAQKKQGPHFVSGQHASSAPQTPSLHQSQSPFPTTPTVIEPEMETAPTSAGSGAPPSSAGAAVRASSTTSNSTVMNETLNVIDEHMEDMRSRSERSASPRSRRSMTLNSVNEYAAIVESSGTYIQGYESEAEEERSEEFLEQDVKAWSPDKVASYLEGVGVDRQHCDTFKEQEFTGDVILAMEQSMMFLKELDLGPIGRRLKTWQKVKALQDAVLPPKPSQTRHVSETSQSHSRRASSGSLGMLHRQSYLADKTGNEQVDELAGQLQAQTQHKRLDGTSPIGTVSSSSHHASPRPSAASVRSLGHSRRHSSLDQSLTHAAVSPQVTQTSHSKQPSLDRNWSMGQTNGVARPNTSAHARTTNSDRPKLGEGNSPQLNVNTAVDIDRGYASGSEADVPRHRRLLTKRAGGEHARASSYEHGKRRSTLMGFRKSSAPTSPNLSRQDISNSVTSSNNDPIATKKSRIVSEPGAPTVTKLEYTEQLPRAKQASKSNHGRQENRSKGLRAISDAVTGREKALHAMVTDNPASPTGSNPQSAGSSSKESRSIDIDEKHTPSTLPTPTTPSGTRRKSKKKTSAYIRGLEKKTPGEQMIGCDYSGWMKKKSSNLMTNWKPRLFVLRGRRLSYFYSENDREEKGLIDISGHRVLPAGNERITTLHATLTKATASNPNSPQVNSNPNGTFSTGSNTPTSPLVTKDPQSASTDSTTLSFARTDSSGQTTAGTSQSSAPPTPTAQKLTQNSGGGFIFKLVPPRVGMSKAVNFTKPTVHYFAVPSVQEGRLWMAALMKATIDRDETVQVVTTYTQNTVSLAKARARKERPPFLNDTDKDVDEEEQKQATSGVGDDGQGSVEGLEKVEEAREPDYEDAIEDETLRGREEEHKEKSEQRASPSSPKTRMGISGEPQMKEVTDLESAVSRRSLGGMSHHHHQRNKSSGGSGFGSRSGLGIQGLNGGGPLPGENSIENTKVAEEGRHRSSSKSRASPLLDSMKLW